MSIQIFCRFWTKALLNFRSFLDNLDINLLLDISLTDSFFHYICWHFALLIPSFDAQTLCVHSCVCAGIHPGGSPPNSLSSNFSPISQIDSLIEPGTCCFSVLLTSKPSHCMVPVFTTLFAGVTGVWIHASLFYVDAGIWTQVLLHVQQVFLLTEPLYQPIHRHF